MAGDSGGAYGVERLYDDRLTGQDAATPKVASIAGLDTAFVNTGGDGAGDDLGGLLEVPPLQLTIDAKLQRQLESELNTARIANQAKSVSGIIMDPHSGAILASASVPGYDANDYAEVAQDGMDQLRDRVVSDIYEPGSVMKIFTAAAALDKGVVTPQTKILDQARLEFYQYTVRNSDKDGLGWLTVRDVIARSRNVGTAKIAAMLAPKDTQKAAHLLYDFWDKVGLVGRTGVDIASEEAGIWWDPDVYQWAPVDLANRAFGQSVGVTLLQLATGYSTFVNGGFRVQPHVVVDGEAAAVPKQRVLKANVAHQALDILTHVTGSVSYYARGSLIPGYMIGGKTGTAQIWDPSIGQSGAWKRNRFNHSFIGFVGGDRPDVVIAVRIEEAVPAAVKPFLDLEIESYELFQMVARGAIKHLGIKRSRDKEAGLPIIGTEAARVLTPERVRRASTAGADSGKARMKATADRKATSGPDKATADRKARTQGHAAQGQRKPALEGRDVVSQDTRRAGARTKNSAGDQGSDPSSTSDA